MTSATKNSFWYLTFNLSRLFVLFFGNIWISRLLGPESFGQLSYFLSVIIYISALDSLCHESIVKQYVSELDDAGLALGTASALNLIITVISVVMIVAFGFFTITESLLLTAFLFLVPGQLSRPLNPMANYFDIRLLSKYSSLALFIGAFVSIVFRTISISFSKDLIYQTVGYSLQTIVYALALYIFFVKKVEISRWRVSSTLLRKMAKRSFPLFMSTLLYLSLSQSDVFMIRHILTVRDVGIYSIVVKLSEPWVIVSSALCTSFFPLIFNPQNSSKKRDSYFVRVNQLSIYFVFFLGLFLCLAIGPIVSILLGPEYSEVSGVFRIYYWGILFLFFANIQHIWEVFNGKYIMGFYRTASACVLKITLNYILGSYFGLYGFATATLISLFFYGFGINLLSKTTRRYLPLQMQAFHLNGSKKNFRWIKQKGKKWLKRKS